jgi:hypothetical protein
MQLSKGETMSKKANALIFTCAVAGVALAGSPAAAQSNSAVALRSGLNAAVQQGIMPLDPPHLYDAVVNTISSVESGLSVQEAASQNQVQPVVLIRLMELGRSRPSYQPASFPTQTVMETVPIVAEAVEPKLSKEERKEQSRLEKALARIEALEQQIESLDGQVTDISKRQRKIEKQSEFFIAQIKSLDSRFEQQQEFLASLESLQNNAVAEAPKPEVQAQKPEPVQIVSADIVQAPKLPPQPTSEPAPEMTPIDMAHALRRGLSHTQGRKEVPYGSYPYRQVQSSIRRLGSGASLEAAAKSVRIDVAVLETLIKYGQS